jgi:rhodanese-related sulfurtransferase
MAKPISATQLQARLGAGDDLVLLDVREPQEFAIGHIEGSLHVPMGDLAVRHTELDPDRPTVCICHHGIRSASVAAALEGFDFRELYNLTGGLERWSLEVDPSMPRY